MGELRLSGISSGIDTQSLIEQIMAIEERRLATYKVSKLDYEEQTTALDELKTNILAAKSAAAGLSNIDTMQLYNASSSDRDILSVSASSDATSGSHSVAIDQLATADTWIQNDSSFDYKTDYVGGGTFIYTYNNQQQTITTVADDTTLEDFVNMINNDTNNPGVSASLLYQGGKYHVMLSGQDSGQDYQISVDSSVKEIWKPDTSQPNSTFTTSGNNAALSTRITELEQFSGALGASDTFTISGKNHDGSTIADTNLVITENTTLGHLVDAINDHFDGVATAQLYDGQIWLTDNTNGASGLEISFSFSGDSTLNLPTMAVDTEGGSISESLASLDSTSFLETQSANNAKIKIDGFPADSTDEVQTLSITGGVPTTGTFRLTLNGETTGAIDFNASAADIQTALLALSGVEAGDVVVSGSDLPAGAMTVTFGGNLAGMDISKMVVSDDSTLDAGIVSVVETTKGNDGWIHGNSNTITDAITGITLNLQDVTATDDSITVTISKNTATLSKQVQTFVTAYNTLIEDLKTKTEYSDETEEMGLLSQDFAATSLKSSIKYPFTTIANGFIESFDSFIQADGIGLTLDGSGNLEFDADEFDDALNEDYKAVLDILGAAKSGHSTSSEIQFYTASDKYTTAGIYNVKVEVNASNEIISAQIKLSTETEYRNASSWDGNTIYFDSSFDDNGNPVNPEHSLQLTVDLTEGVYGTDEDPVTVRVKQGIFGALEDLLVGMTENNGRLDISVDAIEDRIKTMEYRIEREEARLERYEEHLVQKYARLESILTANQQQMAAVSAMLGG